MDSRPVLLEPCFITNPEFLGDSVDSRHRGMLIVGRLVAGFWGIVWTAGMESEELVDFIRNVFGG